LVLIALLAQDEHLATDVRRMYVADIPVRPGLRGGECHGQLRFGLDHLFNPNLFDLKPMGVLQFVDQGEFHLIALVHHQARWSPELGAVEDHGNQRELLGFSGCGSSSAQYQESQTHNEPAEAPAPAMDLSHRTVSFLLYRR
jgi:hypothetical protein